MKTAVEWLADEIIMLEERLRQEEINLNDFMDLKDDLVTKALEMEKMQLLQISTKSAHYERKWILEHSTESKYNPSKVEIRDLEKTALEHYNETFKQQEQ
jgi:tRNA A37 threonylcarbamoyladenosine dehydratase